MSDCLFCKIVDGEIPSNKVYEDDEILAFNDVAPQAPVHFLIVPKKHMESLDDTTDEDAALLAHIMLKIKDMKNNKDMKSNKFMTNNRDMTKAKVMNNKDMDNKDMIMHMKNINKIKEEMNKLKTLIQICLKSLLKK